MHEIKSICIIGAGNVASVLGKTFFKKGYQITQVFSRNISKAKALADKLNSEGISDISEINDKADVYLLMISDDAIETVATNLSKTGLHSSKIVAHTSGFSSIELVNKFSSYGVFWPLQTFTKGEKIKIRNTPICIHGNNEVAVTSLQFLANSISKEVHIVKDDDRKYLHIAAVFANNFSNHMYTLANEIAEDHGLEFQILLPLIRQTFRKLKKGDPSKFQTGPAARNDTKVLKAQMELLSKYQDKKKLYEIISKSIIQKHHHED